MPDPSRVTVDTHPAQQHASIATFSTRSVPPEHRIPLWEEFNRRYIVELKVETYSRHGLQGTMRHMQVGRVAITDIVANDHVVRSGRDRTPQASQGGLGMTITLKGTGFLYQSGLSVPITAGDVVTHDPDSPRMLGFASDMHQLVVAVPRELHFRRTGNWTLPQGLVSNIAQGETFASNIVALVGRLLSDPASSTPAHEGILLDLFDLIAEGVTGSSMTYYIAAKDYIRAHLHESDLSVRRIASAVAISERQLARTFASQHASVAATVAEIRLQRAHELLGDVRRLGTPIHGIAKSLGFTSSSHFSKAFRQRFGYSPTEVRALARATAKTILGPE
jgi:AraC-like DNA-binding protein